jgi:predicted nucleic acid-binding protein
VRARFPLVLPGPSVLDRGLELHRKHQVSYWDSLLLAACEDYGVTRLYSEDFQASPRVAGVEIVNPLPPVI